MVSIPKTMETYYIKNDLAQTFDIINAVWVVDYNDHAYDPYDQVEYLAGVFTSLKKAMTAFPKVRWVKAEDIEFWKDSKIENHDWYFGFVDNETEWYRASYQIYEMELNKTYHG